MTWEPTRVKLGTVGRAIPGEEVRLADDGEVLARGGNVFRGYLNDPERTAEALDADGWLHTGDIGVLDDDGYLRIVDRKKELIITASGKNVSPANLEAALKAQPLIGQACAIGDGEAYMAALLVLDPDVVPAWAASHGATGDDARRARGAIPWSWPRSSARSRVANERFSHAEAIREFTVLPDEWLPDTRGAHAHHEAQATRHRGRSTRRRSPRSTTAEPVQLRGLLRDSRRGRRGRGPRCAREPRARVRRTATSSAASSACVG